VDLFQIIGWFWNNGLVIPMTNFLVLLTRLSFGNFGVAIILFTLIMRVITWPITRQQFRASRAMQVAQPRIQELQKKYKDPKRRSEETMKIYREVGFSPLGCIWPMLIQMPIWFALYRAIRFTLSGTPEVVLGLSQKLYPWGYLHTAVPLNEHFLWLSMGKPDPTLIMAILVGASMWIQQRMTTPVTASADPQQQQMNQTMMWMMPLMFAFFTLRFPSGLALYWVATNVIGIVIQYFYQGPSTFSWRRIFSMSPTTAPAPAMHSAKKDEPAQDADEDVEATTEEVAAGAQRRRRRRRGRRRR
jgi:YidC/Oxa1 family membrane protein insertase